MPLTYTGVESEHGGKWHIEAYDGKRRVVIFASEEAVEDSGLARVKVVGERKYLAGDREDDGEVWVFGANCR